MTICHKDNTSSAEFSMLRVERALMEEIYPPMTISSGSIVVKPSAQWIRTKTESAIQMIHCVQIELLFNHVMDEVS